MNECVMTARKNTQSNKFKEAARDIGANHKKARWEERLKKVAKAKPGKGG